jgi:hypothetical protein
MENRLSISTRLGMALLALGLIVSDASGLVNVTGGTLHVFVNDGSGFTVAPADKPFVAPTTSAAADFLPPFPTLFARETVSFAGGQAVVSTQTLWSGGTTIASGTLNLTEDAPQTMQVHINPGTVGPYYLGTVSLDAVGGGNIFNTSFGASSALLPINLTAPLSPGQYILTWNDTGRIFLFQGGGGGFDMTLSAAPAPEPSSLMLIGMAAPWLLTRRRRNR